ncbi:MAG: hypothetical protein ACJ790_16705, partial [Myxococcaceae bacterium]
MSKAEDQARRIRLEGAADELYVASLRYRAVIGVLRGLLWRERLFKNADVASAVARSWASVQRALAKAQKLRTAEAWSPRSELSRLIDEVAELSQELEKQVRKRHARPEPMTVAEALFALIDGVTPKPRGDALKWKLAKEALPDSLPVLGEVRDFAALLASLFGRPPPVKGGFPWSVEEARALEVQLPVGEAKIAELWRRVSQGDSAERVERMLLNKARHTPKAPPADGPQTLVTAEFWRKFAWQKIHDMFAEHVAPVSVRDAEALRVFTFLAESEQNPKVVLEPSPTLNPGRAALITLSRTLWRGAIAAKDEEWE